MTQTTTQTTKVPFAQLTPEEQQVRIAEQHQRDVETVAKQGLANGRRIFGFLKVAQVQENHLVSESGKAGKRFFFVLTVNKEDHPLSVRAYTPKTIAYYQSIVDFKSDNRQKATASALVGDYTADSGKVYENLVALFPNKH